MLVSSWVLKWLRALLFLSSSSQIRAHGNAKFEDTTLPFTIARSASDHAQTSTIRYCPILSVKEVSEPTTSPLHLSDATNTPGQATARHHTAWFESEGSSRATVIVVYPLKADPTSPMETKKLEAPYDGPSALCSTTPTTMPSTGDEPVQTLLPMLNGGRSLAFKVPNLCPATHMFSERSSEAPISCKGPFASATAFVLVSNFYLDHDDVLGERDLGKLRCERKIFREEVRRARSKWKAQRSAQARSRYIVSKSMKYFRSKQRSELNALILYVAPSRWNLEKPDTMALNMSRSAQMTPHSETGQIQLLPETPIDNLSLNCTPAIAPSKGFLRYAFLRIKDYMTRLSLDFGYHSLIKRVFPMPGIETGVSRHLAMMIGAWISAVAFESIASKMLSEFDPQISNRRCVGLVVLLGLITLDILSKAVPPQIGYFLILFVLRHLSATLKASSNAPIWLIGPWIYLELLAESAFDVIWNAFHRFARSVERMGWHIVIVAIITRSLLRQLQASFIQLQKDSPDGALPNELPVLRDSLLPHRRNGDARYTPRPYAPFDDKIYSSAHAQRWTRTTRIIDDD